MDIDTFLARVDRGERVAFTDTMEIIDSYYEYQPTRFYNGIGSDRLVNSAGRNEGSCKIFTFAKLQKLSEKATLALFGDFYWMDVLIDPNGKSHGNIRAFMKYGWDGIAFDGTALVLANHPDPAPETA